MKGVKPLILAGIVAASAAVHANDLNTVIDKSSEINNLAAQSQTKIDKIADSMQGRLQQFKTLNKEIDGLAVYNAQLTKQLNNQIVYGYFKASVNEYSWLHSRNACIVALLGTYL